MTTSHESFGMKLLVALASAMFMAGIAFFVWLASISTRVTVLEQSIETQRAAQDRIERANGLTSERAIQANKESTDRIEHEREANDARVRDDLRELRNKVFR